MAKGKAGVRVHSIFLDILFTILTFGLFNLWVQIRQCLDVNELLGRDKFSILKMIIFSILTFGLYFCYYEYKMTHELHVLVKGQEDAAVEIMLAVMTFFCLWFIVDSYQQNLLNQHLLKNSLPRN